MYLRRHFDDQNILDVCLFVSLPRRSDPSPQLWTIRRGFQGNRWEDENRVTLTSLTWIILDRIFWDSLETKKEIHSSLEVRSSLTDSCEARTALKELPASSSVQILRRDTQECSHRPASHLALSFQCLHPKSCDGLLCFHHQSYQKSTQLSVIEVLLCSLAPKQSDEKIEYMGQVFFDLFCVALLARYPKDELAQNLRQSSETSWPGQGCKHILMYQGLTERWIRKTV